MKNLKYILGITFFTLILGFAVSAAPTSNIFRNLMPEANKTYNLGSTTTAWNILSVYGINLNGDFKTAWPTGGGGGTDVNWVYTLSSNSLSTNTSTSQIILQGDSRLPNINASSTQIGTLLVYNNATTTGHLAALGGNSDQWNLAYSWGNHALGGYASSTALANKIDTGQFNGLWAIQYNATTTLNGFTPGNYETTVNFANDWKTQYNATTTLNGFTPGNYLLTSAFVSNFNSNVIASTTMAWGKCNNGQIFKSNGTNWLCAADDTGGVGGGPWPVDQWVGTTSTPTFVSLNATSTQIGTLSVYTNIAGAGWDSAWASKYNATTTLNGFTPGNYVPISWPGYTDGRISPLNSSSTQIGTLKVYSGSDLNGLTTASDLRLANGLNASSTSNFANLKVYGNTDINSATIPTLNSSTTNIGALTVYGNTVLNGDIGTPSIPVKNGYFDVIRTKWLEVSQNIIDNSLKVGSSTNALITNLIFQNTAGSGTISKQVTTNDFSVDIPFRIPDLNASSTKVGKILNYGSSTTTHTLYVGSYASSTGGLFTKGNGHYGGTLTVDGNITTLATSTGKAIVATDANAISTFAGNVGIGTEIPSYPLQIGDFSHGHLDNVLNIAGVKNNTDGDVAYGELQFSNMANTIFAKIAASHYVNNNGTRLDFYTAPSSGTGAVSNMSILGNGNVGIGTTTPLSMLDLGGPSTVAGSSLGFTANSNSNYRWILHRDNLTTGNLFLDETYNGVTTNKVTFQSSTGNVGIGTSTPAFPLTVAGANVVIDRDSASYGAYLQLNRKGSSKWMIIGGASSLDEFAIRSSNLATTRLNITQGGNVGIGLGDTLADAKLEVSGTTLLGGAASTTGTLVVNGTAGSSAWTSPTSTLTVVGSGYFTTDLRVSNGINASSTSNFANLNVYGSVTTTGSLNVNNKLFVDQHTGNVGIGTTAPTQSLTINAVSTAGPSTSAAAGNFGLIQSAAYGLQAGVYNTGNTWLQAGMVNGTAGTYAILLNPLGGNVGIGTTGQSGQPAVKLDVYGSTATNVVGTEDEFHLTRLISGSKFPQLAAFQLGTWQVSGTTPNTRLDINLKTTADNTLTGDKNIMTLLDSGNVGIGTTAPSGLGAVGTTLQIQGATTLGVLTLSTGLTTTNTEMGELNFGSTGTASVDKRGAIIASFMRAASGTNMTGDLEFYTVNAGSIGERMRITSSGYLGIGTTAPNALLHVAGTTLLAGNASTTGTLVVNATANSSAWNGATSTLTVVGSGLFTGNLNVSGNTTNTGTLFVGANPQTLNWGAPTSTLTISGSVGYNPFMVVSSTRDLLFRVNNSGALELGGGIPTVGCAALDVCTPTLGTGSNDQRGIVNVTTNSFIDTITITFSTAKPSIPFCVANMDDNAVSGVAASTLSRSTAAVVFRISPNSTGGSLTYICVN